MKKVREKFKILWKYKGIYGIITQYRVLVKKALSAIRTFNLENR